MKSAIIAALVLSCLLGAHAQTVLTLNKVNGPYDVEPNSWHQSVVTATGSSVTVSVQPCLAQPMDWYVKTGSAPSDSDTPVFTWPSTGMDVTRSHTVTGLAAGSKVYIGVKNRATANETEVSIDVSTSTSGSGLVLAKNGVVTAVEAECGGAGHVHGADDAEVEVTWGGTGAATDEYQVYWHQGNPHDEGKTLGSVCGIEDLMSGAGAHDHDHRLRVLAEDEEKGTAFTAFTKNVQKACLDLKKGKTYYINVMARAADGSRETAYKAVMVSTSSAVRAVVSVATVVLAAVAALLL
eukprot:TRINITY_DN17772_c0_g2_i1.p1 TRINITY_DN17772_c0_g2~~TRINITY_DN17772_c0_g2_i1.p1  ORF type:complete len:330 (-),score=89.59 TRINITY_DN17772_c0_g2_i1:41-925(-)